MLRKHSPGSLPSNRNNGGEPSVLLPVFFAGIRKIELAVVGPVPTLAGRTSPEKETFLLLWDAIKIPNGMGLGEDLIFQRTDTSVVRATKEEQNESRGTEIKMTPK